MGGREVRTGERESVRKILPSPKCLVIRACISPLLEENQPSKPPNRSYCLCFQFIPPLTRLFPNVTNTKVRKLVNAGGTEEGRRKGGQ